MAILVIIFILHKITNSILVDNNNNNNNNNNNIITIIIIKRTQLHVFSISITVELTHECFKNLSDYKNCSILIFFTKNPNI